MREDRKKDRLLDSGGRNRDADELRDCDDDAEVSRAAKRDADAAFKVFKEQIEKTKSKG